MIVIAIYESTNFTFTAYGESETHAINTLKRGLDQHTTDYGLDVGWWHPYANDIYVQFIEVGKTYRDHESLKVAP